MSDVKGYVITDTYTETNFMSDFGLKFPEFTVSPSGMIDIAFDIIPDGVIDYLSEGTVKNMSFYTLAHLAAYFDWNNASTEVKSVLRNASSMTASTLSIGYEGIAKMKGDLFSSLNDFLNTTAYGRIAALYLEKIAGSSGGFCI